MAAAEIYSEGRGIFDAMPYVKAMEAKQKARDLAVTNYFKDLSTKINTAGVRSQDIIDPKTGKGIQTDINDWMDFYKNNRDAIMKGGLQRLEFEKKQREILNRIEQSKNVAKFENDLGKAKFEGKYDPDDDDMKAMDRVGASIYNPYHYKEHASNPAYVDNRGTEFTWGDVSLAIPGLTTAEQDKVFDYALQGAKLELDPNDKGILRDGTKIYNKKYTDKSLVTGANNMYMTIKDVPVSIEEKKLKKYYNKAKDDPYFLAQADPLYMKYFGKNIETAADAAAADFLMKKIQVQEPLTIRLPQPRKGGGGRGGEKIDENLYYITDQVVEDVGVPMNVTIKGKTETKKIVFLKDVDPERLSIITGQDLSKGIAAPTPMTFNVIQRDGTTKPEKGYYVDEQTGDWYGAGDQKISREAAKDRYIEKKAATKVKIGVGTKAQEVTPTQKKGRSMVAEKAMQPTRTEKIKGTKQKLY